MAKKVFRYIVVGVIGTATHVGALVLLVEIFYMDPVLSSTLGFILTVIVSYILNYFWTFESSQNHIIALSRYVIVSVTGLLLNVGIMHLTVNILGWWYILGQATVSFVIPVTNFLMNNYWSFKSAEKNIQRASCKTRRPSGFFS